ncbi:MAG: response regulator [Desulfosarcinaceae bacterium]|nr:response regulator [Desulfosarcinaceae bacterium]
MIPDLDQIRRVLIIDDEPANVRVLSISLRSDGYEVLTAFSGEEGIARFVAETPDIVLTDIKMPGLDGIQVLKEIRGRTDDVEVIIITGHGDIDNAIEALQYGASDFINKPIRDEALAVALYRAKEKLALKRLVEAHTDELEIEVQRATRELRRQANFQAKLIGSSNDGIVATDANFNIVLFNPGAERIFGWDGSEVVGLRKGNDFYPPDIDDVFQSDLQRHETRKELPWRETTIVARDGERIPVRFSATLLYEETEMMGSVAFFQDLREVKRLEHELVQSERLAAIGQTVAGLAHGVKNVLQGFKGGSYLVDIGIEKQDTEKLKKGWAMIQRSIANTSDLVLDLLSYSKQREPEFEACDPNAVVEDIVLLMGDTARSHAIALTTDLDPQVGEVVMDPRTLHSSLLNLVTNALDACIFDGDTSKRFSVSITSERKTDGWLHFSVADNGIGMPAEVRARLFSSFFSTKGHRGTGLGLLVTRKLIEEHGGDIAFESQAGRGTTFTVRLPFQPVEAHSPPQP